MSRKEPTTLPIIWDKRGNAGSRVRGTDQFILAWWEENKNRQWSPMRGAHLGFNEEPTEIELQKVEKEFKNSLDKSEIGGDTFKEDVVHVDLI